VETLKICSQAATEAGAPEGLIGWITEPSMEATTQLMHHKNVDLILSTGGGGLVKAAYSSGKPAYGVGPGNVPVYIEKTADVSAAVKKIVDSKTFDNGTICATEQAIVVDKSLKETTMQELKRQGTYFLNQEEKEKVGAIISHGNGQVNADVVGKSAVTVAEMAGISVPADTRLLIAEEDQFGKNVPFSIEVLSTAFGMYTADSQAHAKEICLKLLNLGGRGHTFSIHSNDDQVIQDFSEAMPVSRVVVNTLSSIGAVGATTNLEPSMTLGCGGYGGNISSDNITARHLFNVKRIAYPTKEVEVPKPGTGSKGTASTNNNLDSIVEDVFNATQQKGNSKINPEKIEQLVKQVLRAYQNQ
jgi:acyl-CoA reductase-like NAD-dependent aldehyde dehydrogenase